MSVVDLFNEAKKRNKNVLPTNLDLSKVPDKEERELLGEITVGEDTVVISSVKNEDVVRIDLIDKNTETVYHRCEYDSYTLWLIVLAVNEVLGGMFGGVILE